MDSTSSPSRSTSSSSPWPEDGSTPTNHTPSSASDTPTTTVHEPPAPNRKRPIPSRPRLSKPFRSPLKQIRSQQSMNPKEVSSSVIGAAAETSSSSSASIRKQRQTLEARLLLLQQANQCLRDDALTALPREIARWREAGQLAAQDLWKMTGADGGDWSGLSSIPTRGDYGLESPSSTYVGASEPRKRAATASPEPSLPPLLQRRSRVHSPGAEEQAAALLSIDDAVQQHKGEDSQGALSEVSLPDLSELLRRSQSIVGASSTPRQRQSLLGTQEAAPSTSSPLASSAKGIERKWNIGSMLDMLGADKSTLAWDVEEEDFRDPSTSSDKGKSKAL